MDEQELYENTPDNFSMGDIQNIEPPRETIFCHMNSKEVEELSQAQGGVDRENKWNVPQFTLLGDLLDENEEFREGLELGIKGWFNVDKDEKLHIESELDSFTNKTLGNENIDLTRSDDQEDILLQDLAKLGSDGDSQIVLLPMNLFELIWESCPEEYRNINKETGLAEFGGWSFLGGLVGGLVGTLILPGIGTGIGAGLGNLGGSYLDEMGLPEEEKTGFLPKLLNAGITGLTAGLGASGFGDAAGAAGSSGVNAGSEALGKASSGGWNVSKAGGRLGDFLSFIPGFSGGSGGAGLGDILGIVGSVLPAHPNQSMMDAFGFGSSSKSKKSHRSKETEDGDDYSDPKKIRRIERADHKKFMHQFNPVLKLQTSDPEFFNHSDFGFKRNGFKNGGKIEPIVEHKPITKSTYMSGDFMGQADNIHVDVPEGCYVFDAQTVSFLGDGNSEAGGKALEEWANSLPSSKSKVKKDIVPCAFSSGEFVLYYDKADPIGVKTLDKLVKKIREYKGIKTSSIPKPTKEIPEYLPKLKKVV